MEITPAIATLLGTGVGSLTTIVATVAVQRVTRARDREHKLWERQVAVLEESLRYERGVVRKRQEAMANPEGDLFLALNEVFQQTDTAKIRANLELYGTPELKAAHDSTFEAFRDWTVAFVQWRGHHKRTGPGHSEEERAEAVRETAKRWPEVERLAAKADEAYDELVRVMRATAIFEPVVTRVTGSANRELSQ